MKHKSFSSVFNWRPAKYKRGERLIEKSTLMNDTLECRPGVSPLEGGKMEMRNYLPAGRLL